jgi:5-methyltetrahydrofolate--homocysteine methyltransferase
MQPLIEELLARSPVLTDGAWGTEFERLGLPAGECPDLWNLQRPADVEQVASAYVEAGSRVILTNTFGANRIALARHGMSGHVKEINHAGVAISRKAAEPRACVFACIGPSGKLLAAGEVTEDELRDAFSEQSRVLAAAGAQALVVETMSDLTEAKLAVAAARETGLPVVACMTFDSGKEADRTMMGIAPEQAAQELAATGADVIGANCGRGIEPALPVCARLARATDQPIWMKPNAGLPKLVGDRAVYTMGAEEFARAAVRLVREGAAFVGGCCGTGREHIRAVRQAFAEV